MVAGSKVLWPEQEDYLALMLMKMRGGSASFQSEKQNDPLDPAECIFKEDLFQFWDAPGRTALARPCRPSQGPLPLLGIRPDP